MDLRRGNIGDQDSRRKSGRVAKSQPKRFRDTALQSFAAIWLCAASRFRREEIALIFQKAYLIFHRGFIGLVFGLVFDPVFGLAFDLALDLIFVVIELII